MSIAIFLGRSLPSLAVLAVLCRPAHAQEWNAEGALALVRRAIERRAAAHADSGVRRYRARAEGVVLFLAELGREPTAPRLVKADQVAVEVYWEAPNQSKQLIVAWRERRYLPTDVRYHRDHLGIVTNDFGDRIRLGEGDEVRDVVHPLSATGLGVYDYALGDEVTVAVGAKGERGRERAREGEEGPVAIRVREALVRPQDPTAPAVVGTLYLDVESARLVRFRFGFTRTAYRQADLEDIAVELENALFDQRYWLPWRQAIEIRRRSAWLDFPIRTTIRGRWTLGDYDFETGFAAELFAGGPYGGLRAPSADTGWAEPLDAVALRAAGQGTVVTDLEGLRREVISIAGAAAVVPHPPARLAFGSVSELVHVNRVQGLAVGLGGSFSLGPRGGGRGVQVMPSAQVGTADSRFLAGVGIRLQKGRAAWQLEVAREIRDVSDWPVISGALNSLLAQEGGRDFGDYVLLEGARASGEIALGRGGGSAVEVGLGIERSKSVPVAAEPTTGSYPENPPLGVGKLAIGRVAIRSRGTSRSTRLETELGLEAGAGGRDYVRATFDGGLEAPGGPLGSTLIVRLRAGAGSRELPTYRAFPLGGRGTLVGEPFRRYGGRRFVHGLVEWQVPWRVPEIRMGSYASTGRTAILAPFFAMGWVGGVVEDSLWQADAGLRPVLGVASELLFRVLRLELGWAIRSRGVGLVIDAAPPWWPVL